MRIMLLLVAAGALGAAGLGLRSREGAKSRAVSVPTERTAPTEIRPAAKSGLRVGPGQAEPVLAGSQ
jgi:hypothetical protein